MDAEHARKALGRFGIVPDQIEQVQSRANRVVWRVTAGREAYALKWMDRGRVAHRTELLTEYLLRNGVQVPPVLRTLDGKPATDGAKGRFLLFPWIPSRNPRYDEDPGMLERMVTLLARFHEVSRGYVAAGGPASRDLLDWPARYGIYTDFLMDLGKRAIRTDDPFSRTFRQRLPWLCARAVWALEQLSDPSYQKLVSASSRDPLLGHGDYSRANLLLDGNGDLVLIDLDQVSVALPVSDLSHLMTLVDHDLQDWSEQRFVQLLDGYQQVRPLSEAERELLLVDQVFPYQAVNLARSYYLKEWGNPASTLPEELERCMRTDREKLAYLGVDRFESN